MQKPTILYITELFPYPADSGAKIKTINTIQTLSKKFNIVLISFGEKKISKKDWIELNQYTIFQKNFALPNLCLPPKINLSKLFTNYLKLKPHFLSQFYSKKAKIFVDLLIEKMQPAVIHIDHLTMAQYLPERKNETWIYEEHNIESELLKSRFQHYEKINKTKVHLFIEYILLFLYEKKNLNKFDHIFAISDFDLKKIKRDLVNLRKISLQKLVYLPINTKISKKNNKELIFIGDMTWHPNKNAIKWFYNRIWPLIREKKPNVKLNIVGQIEKEEKEMLTDSNITIWGYQKDLRLFLRSKYISILPFKVGSGVRIKALTSIAASQPIISTSIGIMGLNLKRNMYKLANEPEKFAHACTFLLNNQEAAERQALHALEYLKREHGEHNNQKYLTIYQRLIKNF